MRKFITFSLVYLFACGPVQHKEDTQILDFGSFTIETPKGWKKLQGHGVDSYVGRIAIDESDTVHFALGEYSNKLFAYLPTVLERNVIPSLDTSMIDTSEVIFVASTKGLDMDTYRRTNIFWDTVANRRVKFVVPIRPGTGITGVYIDSLWIRKYGVDHFNFYGENLKPENQSLFLGALRTLKFYEDR